MEILKKRDWFYLIAGTALMAIGAEGFFEHADLVAGGITGIVLASDGYPFLKPTLSESEEALEEQRRRDPLNITTFKATKAFRRGMNSFDDRSYIRFTV